jgi:hypothetical protein
LPVSKPFHEIVGGSHTLMFEPEGVVVKIDRVHEDSRYDVKADVLVEKAGTARNSHVHFSRLLISGGTARKSYADYCFSRSNGIPDKEDWRGLVEMACVLVIRASRQGEPFVWVPEIEEDTSAEFLLKPVVLDGRPQVLFANGGTGKTLIAHYWSVLIAAGMSANGFSAEQGNVLILDYETDRRDTRERIKWVSAGLGIDAPKNIAYRYCHVPVADDVEVLGSFIAKNDIKFVMIDSANSAVGGEPESAEAVGKYFTALRSMHVSTLTLAHVAKGSERNGPFGSAFWHNYPRLVFELNSDQKPSESQFNLGIEETKTNWGQRQPPIALETVFDSVGRSVTFERTTAITVETLKEQLKSNVAQDMERHLRDSGAEGRSVRELAEDLGLTEGTVRTTLNRNKQRFVKDGSKWIVRES